KGNPIKDVPMFFYKMLIFSFCCKTNIIINSIDVGNKEFFEQIIEKNFKSGNFPLQILKVFLIPLQHLAVFQCLNITSRWFPADQTLAVTYPPILRCKSHN